MGEQKELIDIPIQEAEVVTPESPSEKDVKEAGWSRAEVELAEKHGMLKQEEKKEEVKKDQEEEKKVVEPEQKKEEATQKEPKFDGVPEYDLTPDQEKLLNEVLPKGNSTRGLYHRMKNERLQRQKFQMELAKEKAERLALEAKINEIGKERSKSEENIFEVDPEEKPLTLKTWKEMQQREMEERQNREKQLNERAAIISQANEMHSESAREMIPDFDDSIKLAQEVMANVNLIDDRVKRIKATALIKQFVIAAGEADKYGTDEYNPAIMAYELGQLHPNYGKRADTDGKQETPAGKDNGGLTPEQMKRLEESNLRRASSASVSGNGGKRTVSADEVDLADLNRMTATQRYAFREKYPARYEKLLRG
jgi:hypothetical protein